MWLPLYSLWLLMWEYGFNISTSIAGARTSQYVATTCKHTSHIIPSYANMWLVASHNPNTFQLVFRIIQCLAAKSHFGTTAAKYDFNIQHMESFYMRPSTRNIPTWSSNMWRSRFHMGLSQSSVWPLCSDMWLPSSLSSAGGRSSLRRRVTDDRCFVFIHF